MRLINLCLLVVVAAHINPPSATACRYTVRDVAFVDLGGGTYHLYGFIDGSTDADWQNNFNVIANATFIDTNVKPTLINIAGDAKNPAIDFLKAAQPSGETKLPAMILVSPAGEVLDVSAIGPTWKGLESLIQSPTRQAVMKPIFDAYAVVVLIEGNDKAANDLATQSIEGAIKQINAIRHTMPKPVKVGPKVVTIKAGDRASEQALLWSFGIDMKAGDDPSVVVVLGQGRKIGPVITSPAILQTDVFEVLNVIGQDCECGLDRKWMQGVSFPYTFDDDYHAAVKTSLGFDPRDAAVIAEMNRILSKGPVPAADLAIGIPRTAERIDPLLGYSESTVGEEESDDATATSSGEIANASTSQAVADTVAVVPTDSKDIIWRIAAIVLGVLLLVAIIGSMVVRRRAAASSSVA